VSVDGSGLIGYTRPTMAEQSFRVGLVQMAMSARPEENTERAAAKLAEAAKAGAEVVCLPEMYRTPYFCQKEDHANFALAEPVPGPSTEALSRAAKRAGVAVVVPIFERRAPGVYHNSAVVLDADGTVVGLYRKMHIPDDPLFYEKFYFAPGDLGFRAFDVKAGRIGTLICWDQWYPEGARLTALRGAAVLFYPTAIGWHPSEKEEHGAAQRSAWQTIQRSHAIANGVYVGVVNRVGHEVPEEGGDGLEFWGTSFLADPFGAVIAEASTDREEILVGEVSLPKIDQVRTHWPFLRDRRVDAYAGIDRRFLDGD
jgi:N-carbamoylputrescine amidase